MSADFSIAFDEVTLLVQFVPNASLTFMAFAGA
jgi:hypothetical protein